MRRVLSLLIVLAFLPPALAQAQLVPVGLAKVDITPGYPVRLAGFGSRRA